MEYTQHPRPECSLLAGTGSTPPPLARAGKCYATSMVIIVKLSLVLLLL